MVTRRTREISDTTIRPMLMADDFTRLALEHLDGVIDDADLALLEAREPDWIAALEHLHKKAEAAVERVKKDVHGPERSLVLADFTEERDKIAEQLATLTGTQPRQRSEVAAERPSEDAQLEKKEDADEPEELGTIQLQLSWAPGQLVAWAGGSGLVPEPTERVVELLHAVGAPSQAWKERSPLELPGDRKADAVWATVSSTLGWLTALNSQPDDDRHLGVSARWLARVAALAVRQVAQGRMVPQLTALDRSKGGAKGGNGSGDFAVRWSPALIHPQEFEGLVRSLPGAVAALDLERSPRQLVEAVVADLVDTICRDAAGRAPLAAPPPRPRTTADVAESFLTRLDGSSFTAPVRSGSEVAKGLATWAREAVGVAKLRLVIQLDPPDEGDAWQLRTLAMPNKQASASPRSAGDGDLEAVDAAMSQSNANWREAIKSELDRLETLYEPLQRGRSQGRGEVILSTDEAWDLMSQRGAILTAAGFDVRVPPLSRKKPALALKLESLDSSDSKVGAQQLTTVRWSALFGDVELTAEDITRLASESKPLVKARGRWVELDHADLQAAAAALAERAQRTQLTGSEMLRHALGLEGSGVPGGVTVTGRNWAADLLESARQVPGDLPTKPAGFEGELRTYQADAVAWLDFLDGAGLGGCLALDMGLGKTPTMLANLRLTREGGPSLVISPPAVLGNWAREAHRFVPDLKVLVHHGPNRAAPPDIADAVADVDVVLTTYGTSVRDIEALEGIAWNKVVLDEAQAIKNPASDTSQQLRRLKSQGRVVLTGTPIENGLGDLWSLLDFTNPGLVGERSTFVASLSSDKGDGAKPAERALRTLNGVLVFRRTKAEPQIAAELPDRIDELQHCPMTPEQIGLYQAVLDKLVLETAESDVSAGPKKKGAVLAAITALKQICNHPAAYTGDREPLDGRSGKLSRLNEIIDNVFEARERVLIFTHFATWGERLAGYLSKRTGLSIRCYHGGLARGARDTMIKEFQEGSGPGALVLSLKAGGTGLNLTAASHVVLYDRWWNPAVEDQARDRAWRIGQNRTVVSHRLICPGTVDERVEEVVAGKRRIADMVLPKSTSVGDLDGDQLQHALGLDTDALLAPEDLED